MTVERLTPEEQREIGVAWFAAHTPEDMFPAVCDLMAAAWDKGYDDATRRRSRVHGGAFVPRRHAAPPNPYRGAA